MGATPLERLNQLSPPQRSLGVGAEALLRMHYDPYPYNRGYPAHVVESVERSDLWFAVLVPGRDVPFVFTTARSR